MCRSLYCSTIHNFDLHTGKMNFVSSRQIRAKWNINANIKCLLSLCPLCSLQEYGQRVWERSQVNMVLVCMWVWGHRIPPGAPSTIVRSIISNDWITYLSRDYQSVLFFVWAKYEHNRMMIVLVIVVLSRFMSARTIIKWINRKTIVFSFNQYYLIPNRTRARSYIAFYLYLVRSLIFRVFM